MHTTPRLRLPDFIISDSKDGKASAQLNKSKVIQKGIEYIQCLEKANADLLAENERLMQLVNPNTATATSVAVGAAAQDEYAGAKRKKIKVEADGGRFLMCVLACGLVAVTVTGNSPAFPSGGGGGTGGLAAHAAGARVLAGSSDPVASADAAWWVTVDFVASAIVYWAWRLFVAGVCVTLLLKQDTVTDPTDALENEAKCKNAEGNTMKVRIASDVVDPSDGTIPPPRPIPPWSFC